MRVFANCVALLSIFFLPPYFTFLFLLSFIFAFDFFLESIFWAYLLDILYGGGGFWIIHFQYIFTVCAIILFFFSFPIKKMLKFYPIA